MPDDASVLVASGINNWSISSDYSPMIGSTSSLSVSENVSINASTSVALASSGNINVDSSVSLTAQDGNLSIVNPALVVLSDTYSRN